MVSFTTVKSKAWLFRKALPHLLAQSVNSAIGSIKSTDICGVDHYAGTPTGVARHTELIWELIASMDKHGSKRFNSKRPIPLNIGQPRVSIWFAQARDMPGAVRRQTWIHANSARNIGYWSWELEQMPAEEAESARFLSEVWVVSSFVACSIRRSCSIPCYVIPPPVLMDGTLHCDKRDYSSLNDFLVTFDAYSSVERKNPWTAISAFQEVFGGDLSRRLTIRVVRANGLPDALRDKLLAYESEQIRVVFETFPSVRDAQMFMSGHDVYLSPHRAEGLGFNIVEAILMGLPVLATNYGGNVDFCDPEGVDLLDYEMVPGVDLQGLYKGSFSWAEPSFDATCAALESLICRTPVEVRRRTQVAREAVLHHFDTARITGLIADRLGAPGN